MLNKVIRKIKNTLTGKQIYANELIVGKNVTIEKGVKISANRLIIGDGVTIKAGTIIEHSDTLIISDYTVFKDGCIITGTNWCYIGPNCWFGHYSVIDSIGTTELLGNVGAGAHSQLWSHIYFGDTLYGSRFATEKPLRVGYDVWFVGHSIVSPINAGDKSMAMVGSVITKDMVENHIYAGAPAKDLTEKIGVQFENKNLDEIKTQFENLLKEACNKLSINKNNFLIVEKIDTSLAKTQFDLKKRLYWKTNSLEEYRLIKYLLPVKAKFFPHHDTDWVTNYKLKYRI